ncbi:MAG: hypothetical protein WB973_02520 [Thermoanaerobaculia bacterium]
MAVLIAVSAYAQKKPITVVVEHASAKGSFRIRISGKSVPSNDLLRLFGELIERHGYDVPLVILVHDSVPLARLSELRGTAEKAGFLHERFFYFTSDRRMMSEITFARAIPFSE